MQQLDFLQQLAGGEILEFQARIFAIRGIRVPTTIARKMLEAGLVESPPDLFAPFGGRITDEGLATLDMLENNHDG